MEPGVRLADMPIEDIHALLEDVNACGSDALDALAENRLSDVRTNLTALLDAVRQALGEV